MGLGAVPPPAVATAIYTGFKPLGRVASTKRHRPPPPPVCMQLGLDPTHQILHSAKDAGFTNVHDYLVHLVTGEDADAIAARKPAQPWGAWLTGHVVERAAAAEGEEGEEEPAGAAAVREGSVSGSCCTASAAVAQVCQLSRCSLPPLVNNNLSLACCCSDDIPTALSSGLVTWLRQHYQPTCIPP